MITRAWILGLVLSAGLPLTAGAAHADVGSRCSDLANRWDAATAAKGDKRQIPSLQEQIARKHVSCPTLAQKAQAYRPAVKVIPVSKPSQDPILPPQPQMKLEACLVEIVKQANAVAVEAAVAEKEAIAAAKEGERHASLEKAAHPDRASAPQGGQWTYEDGSVLKYWGDTVGNNLANGYGVFENSNGNRTSGLFKNGAGNGPSIYKYKGGAMIGIFKDGQAIGPGVIDFGDTRHARIMEAGPHNKYVVVTFRDGSTFKGRMPDAKNEAPGVMYGRDGKIVNAGIFSYYVNFSRKITKSDCSG